MLAKLSTKGKKVTQSTIRTRFAPSPTGDLHIGGARTALFCWLYAKASNGDFVLRIEDTDLERSTQSSIDAILESMDWLKLDYNEGPIYQTKRMDRYREVIDQLLESGHAYRCNCSRERIDELREKQRAAGEKPRYDGHCRDKAIDASEQHVIRFKNPLDGEVSFDDIIRGTITVANCELDDLIIARSDGSPTYNLTVVVDDWDMKITHVIRGDDHINNTPRQINLLKALGAELPLYGHVPMILGADSKRLSKRHGATSVLAYREQGILPSALINYLARLGWSHGDQELFTVDELIAAFGLQAINNSPATFDPDKLLWVNQQHMQSMPCEQLLPHLQLFLGKANTSVTNSPAIADVIEQLTTRSKTLIELADQVRYFYHDPESYAEKAERKELTEASLPVLDYMLQELTQLADWSVDGIAAIVKDAMEALSIKMNKIAQPLRTALTGDTNSPSINVTLFLIGRKACCRRIETAIEHTKAKLED
jgi:glutamyl-tRNA synthetase